MCAPQLVTAGGRDGIGATAPRRTGMLIIRAWIEEGSSEPLRAELRISSDVSGGFDRTVTLSQTRAVCDTVLEWLDDVLEEPDRSC